MIDLLTLIPGKKKKTAKGWWSFNAVCCHHRGHKPDTRKRGGVTFENDTDWTYHCFNCSYSCRFSIGKSISFKTRQLLKWLGCDDEQIDRWSFQSFQHKDLLDYVKLKQAKKSVVFTETSLPDGEILSVSNPKHELFVKYIESRGLDVSDYPYLITPHETGRNANRIIIPYTYKNKIVGHISRFLDDRTPKYIKEQQTGYVFGIDFQRSDWEVCIVMEGIFDALSLNGCALTHNDISDEQAEILKKLKRKIIVVPDIDKAGLSLCDRALDLGFHVSIPDWGDDVKDANDAVCKYGKLPTLLSILQNATSSKIKIQLKRTKLAKRL